mmetsp:Transcript_102678/g.314063  ORF Transcript_102678/g.314063 Transcript_102678/m.314063 type:complete len:238 (+) Transcript_102678:595-1308(+)
MHTAPGNTNCNVTANCRSFGSGYTLLKRARSWLLTMIQERKTCSMLDSRISCSICMPANTPPILAFTTPEITQPIQKLRTPSKASVHHLGYAETSPTTKEPYLCLCAALVMANKNSRPISVPTSSRKPSAPRCSQVAITESLAAQMYCSRFLSSNRNSDNVPLPCHDLYPFCPYSSPMKNQSRDFACGSANASMKRSLRMPMWLKTPSKTKCMPRAWTAFCSASKSSIVPYASSTSK